jgi:putative membrane protein
MTRYLGVLTLAVALAGCTNSGTNSGEMNSRADMRDGGQRTGTLGSADEQFVMEAAAGGMYEVEAGQIGTNKGTSSHVKMVAQQMVKDHSKANDELMQIAKRKAVAMPPTLTGEQQEMIRKLNNLQGSEFDREYLKQQEKAHRDTIAKFQAEARNGRDPEIKQFAAQTLPTLQEHLRMITKGGNTMRMGSER